MLRKWCQGECNGDDGTGNMMLTVIQLMIILLLLWWGELSIYISLLVNYQREQFNLKLLTAAKLLAPSTDMTLSKGLPSGWISSSRIRVNQSPK